MSKARGLMYSPQVGGTPTSFLSFSISQHKSAQVSTSLFFVLVKIGKERSRLHLHLLRELMPNSKCVNASKPKFKKNFSFSYNTYKYLKKLQFPKPEIWERYTDNASHSQVAGKLWLWGTSSPFLWLPVGTWTQSGRLRTHVHIGSC